MSRNKTIKLMHDFTGRTYKDCRAELKAHHWNLYEVLGSKYVLNPELLKRIEQACENASESLRQFGEAITHFAEVVTEQFGKILEPFIDGTNVDQIVIDEVIPEQIDSK